MTPIGSASQNTAARLLHPAAHKLTPKVAAHTIAPKVAAPDADGGVKVPVVTAPTLTPGRFLNKTA